MIRTLKHEDLNDVMQIWLGANLQAHSFISKEYWIEHFDFVREMISQAEVYVYENVRTHTIEGFIGLEENDIAGIFVTESVQSIGIGKQLLDYVKLIKQSLCLRVYRKNERAVAFYRREGFVIRGQSVDADTGEEEFLMVWVNA
ncbi:MAG: GNAT family N-acetyltransferase [Faecousia sp.]